MTSNRAAGISDGYVTEVDYPGMFHRALVPHQIGVAALLRGYLLPLCHDRPLRVLELGCGPGTSANIIAAANPQVDYYAVDVSPSHIERARRFAAAVGTANVTFIEAAFEELDDERLSGTFDLITLHGVYTWVSAANREHIIRTVRRTLRPSGLLYVSYNAFPGWAPLIPIQRLFRDVSAAQADRPVSERLRAGIAIFRKLAAAGALAITSNTSVVPTMLGVEASHPDYVAHEYLNDSWKVFHFGEVVDDMARAGLVFAGSARPLDHVEATYLSPEQMAVLNTAENEVLRQSYRDIIVNEFFRADIFAGPAAKATPQQVAGRWAAHRFAWVGEDAALGAAENATQKAGIDRRLVADIVAALAAGPATLGELAERTGLPAATCPAVCDLLAILVGHGWCEPALAAADEAQRQVRTDLVNTWILERVAAGDDLPYLVSPVTGAAVEVDRLTQFALLARRPDAGARADQVLEFVGRFGARSPDMRGTVRREIDRQEVMALVERTDRVTMPMLERLKIGGIGGDRRATLAPH